MLQNVIDIVYVFMCIYTYIYIYILVMLTRIFVVNSITSHEAQVGFDAAARWLDAESSRSAARRI